MNYLKAITLAALVPTSTMAGTLSPFMGPLDQPAPCENLVPYDLYKTQVFPRSDAPDGYRNYKILRETQCGYINWELVNMKKRRPKAREDIVDEVPEQEPIGTDQEPDYRDLVNNAYAGVSVWNSQPVDVLPANLGGSNRGGAGGSVFNGGGSFNVGTGSTQIGSAKHTYRTGSHYREGRLKDTYRYGPVKPNDPAISAVPLPAGVWMLLAALGLVVARFRR